MKSRRQPPPPALRTSDRYGATRRAFLKAVGAGAATLPFYRLLEDSVAQAAGATPPLRFIGAYHPHGVSAEYWAMLDGRFSGLGSDTETNFNLTYSANGGQCSLQPFDDAATYGKSYKSKILAIEGIDLMSNANGHDTAGTILTGSEIDSSAKKPKNSSLDQYLAVERQLGMGTPVTSISLGVGDNTTQSGTTLSYGPGGAALPKIIDPVQAFKTLFANYVPTNDPNAAAALMRQQMLGKSVVDFVMADVNRLYPKLASTEQQKLDQHLSSLRDLEKQFQPATAGTMGPACMPPSKPDATKFPYLQRYNQGEPYFDVITNTFIDLIVQAFACDITRFVTFFMADLSYMNNLLGLPADNHGGVAHTYSSSPLGNDGHPGGTGDAASQALLAKFNRYSYGKLALLMQKLDAAGVLDSVLIYASSDMGNPAQHSTHNVPTLLAGGANGKFRMGRRLKRPVDCATSNSFCSPTDSTFDVTSTNSHLLVSIAQAFGLTDVTSFGTQSNKAWTTGTLANLT
jgi:hypothetical protein